MNKTNKPIKIILVEDHLLVREGLKQILLNNSKYKVLGEASESTEAIKLVKKTFPDIVLLDIGLHPLNGFEICKIIKREYRQIKVLFVTIFNDIYSVKKAINVGANGYIDKFSLASELLKAIDHIARGEFYLSEAIANSESYNSKNWVELITFRELEILKKITNGLTSKEIAENLYLAKSTVETHRKNIKRKLKANNTANLIKKAYQLKLIPINEVD